MLKCALSECTIAFMDILFKFTDTVCKFEPGHYQNIKRKSDTFFRNSF